MKELNYPFDADYILTKKRIIKRQLLNDTSGMIQKNVAILGGYTTNDIRLILELFLLNYGIKAEFYESEYNQFYQDAVFDNNKLEKFKPDIIYICTSNRNVMRYPSLEDGADIIENILESEISKYRSIWDSIETRYGCPIIQNNFEMPFYRLMGNRDANDIHGRVNYLSRLNMAFYEYSQTHENFYICDINYISADYGLREWSDPFYYYMYKYALNVNAIPYLAFNVANIIKSIFGKNKKGFVLDLDNTLWGGVIGDDGVDNIVLGTEDGEGQAYLEFQKYIKEHMDLGVVLNINSKNEFENVLSGLKHPDSVLTKEDFVLIKANWSSKDENFAAIANSLNLLPESLLFIDDNPAERQIVTRQLPEVISPEIGKVYQYIQRIDRGGYFEVTTLSADDYNRNAMYKENLKRAELQAEYKDYSEYLRTLEMKAVVRPFESVYFSRIAQLTNKSNQFNVTTKRYTQKEIEYVAADMNYITLYGKLADKFGDNGVVTAVIGHVIDDICHLDLWVMSCRVLKRDMEFVMMDILVRECKKRGILEIRGYYYPTPKNKLVKDFYEIQGFSKINEDEEQNSKWSFKIDDKYEYKNKVIQVEG